MKYLILVTLRSIKIPTKKIFFLQYPMQKIYQAEKVRLNKQISTTRIENIIEDPTSKRSLH